MLNDRLAAAKMVAEKISALESAIDEALTCAAELTAATPVARKRAKLSPVVGQEAVSLVGDVMVALHAARAKSVAAHGEFASLRDAIGIKPSMTGDLWKFVDAAREQPALTQVA
ncbi:hypothetical protein [Sphingorhabdus contaminans]|uniref:Uncharacterized protein n=1 Tax=Sphingorhabdus contaminans TaxID=1343899 RepID=A0A553WA89_9SPHN|nr:hypothetical protein [Sphingorhabdus contaminans]TSB01596.1 hypothetical protein FOM92_10445 [Sphingorhabdus contaminans]